MVRAGFDNNYKAQTQKGKAGHLHILEYAINNGCQWNEGTCMAAAGAGHLHILKWAYNNGCNWDESTCRAAAEAGHMQILQFAQDLMELKQLRFRQEQLAKRINDQQQRINEVRKAKSLDCDGKLDIEKYKSFENNDIKLPIHPIISKLFGLYS